MATKKLNSMKNLAWRVLVHLILGALMLLFVGSLGKNLDLIEEASEGPTPYCDWWCMDEI
ncbi:type VI secretion protein VasK [Sesbania bispinosa]|nr:type VI secretion protein VasK [Sesbania bispinosa]